VSKVKNFLSRRVDNFRPSYGRRNRDFPRQNVFAATTNEREYLEDPTGNRRIWPVHCDGPVDLAGLQRDREQLWAEAVALYQAATPWWPGQELVELCKPEQALRTCEDPWTGPILKWIRKPTQDSPQGSCSFDISGGIAVADVLVHAVNKHLGMCTLGDEIRVGRILQQLKYERRQHRSKEDWRLREWRYFPAQTSPTSPDENDV
jgi:putative DNA primase/helicase